MRILVGVTVFLLLITVAFGVGFLGVFGESSSTATAGPPPVHAAVLMPKTTGPGTTRGRGLRRSSRVLSVACAMPGQQDEDSYSTGRPLERGPGRSPRAIATCRSGQEPNGVLKTAVRLHAEHKVNLGTAPSSVREGTAVARVARWHRPIRKTMAAVSRADFWRSLYFGPTTTASGNSASTKERPRSSEAFQVASRRQRTSSRRSAKQPAGCMPKTLSRASTDRTRSRRSLVWTAAAPIGSGTNPGCLPRSISTSSCKCS